MFPNLKTLDGKMAVVFPISVFVFDSSLLPLSADLFVWIAGERVAGRGSDLYQLCKDIDETIKGRLVLKYVQLFQMVLTYFF